jgi:hypothetical protein
LFFEGWRYIVTIIVRTSNVYKLETLFICIIETDFQPRHQPPAIWVNTTRYCKYSQVLLMMGKTCLKYVVLTRNNKLICIVVYFWLLSCLNALEFQRNFSTISVLSQKSMSKDDQWEKLLTFHIRGSKKIHLHNNLFEYLT